MQFVELALTEEVSYTQHILIALLHLLNTHTLTHTHTHTHRHAQIRTQSSVITSSLFPLYSPVILLIYNQLNYLWF